MGGAGRRPPRTSPRQVKDDASQKECQDHRTDDPPPPTPSPLVGFLEQCLWVAVLIPQRINGRYPSVGEETHRRLEPAAIRLMGALRSSRSRLRADTPGDGRTRRALGPLGAPRSSPVYRTP